MEVGFVPPPIKGFQPKMATIKWMDREIGKGHYGMGKEVAVGGLWKCVGVEFWKKGEMSLTHSLVGDCGLI